MKSRRFLPVLATIAACGAVAASAGAGAGTGLKSTPQLDGTCATTGGGRVVAIPGFPGERIDRRLLNDIRWLRQRYPIFITDGWSDDPVHAENGEHPLGLALDIVPDKAAGGTWQDITRLARWAEPRQNRPRTPFRWVGYDGDEGHGRRHHLHLSWNHSVTKPGRTARTVYTVRCPTAQVPGEPAPPEPPAPEPPIPDPPALEPPPTGGIGGKKPPSGGIGARLAPVVVETGGADLPAR